MSASRVARHRVTASVVALLLACAPLRAADFYVDWTAPAGGDGLSWQRAFQDCWQAIGAAHFTPEVDTIRVAEGGCGEVWFDGEDVRLLGGYPSGGGARDPVAHRTQIANVDLACVQVSHAPRQFLLDGFTLYSNYFMGECRDGSPGMYLVGSRAQVANCEVRYMIASTGSGAVTMLIDEPVPADAPPLLARCHLWDNTAGTGQDPWRACEAGAVFVTTAAPQPSPRRLVVASHCTIERNAWPQSWHSPSPWGAGGIVVDTPDPNLTLLFDHVTVRDNRGSGMLLAGNVELRSCQITGNEGWGVLAACYPATSVLLENCTVAGNTLDAFGAGRPSDPSGAAEGRSFRLLRSIEWNNAGATWQQDSAGCPNERFLVEDSLVEGGWPGGIDVLDADPQFVAGPDDGFYLSQVASGQATDSPAVDAGNVSATSAGFASETTRTDGAPDAGAVDLGAHRGEDDLSVVNRGLTPRQLDPTAYVLVRRWTDYDGSLHMTTEPLVCYDVPSAGGTLRVSADLGRDAVALSW